jgi:1,4-dihydroxy-2-naphthoate octaprenyltransferase
VPKLDATSFENAFDLSAFAIIQSHGSNHKIGQDWLTKSMSGISRSDSRYRTHALVVFVQGPCLNLAFALRNNAKIPCPTMFTRSSWLHLRIPFSYFLLPVFLFSVAISPHLGVERVGCVFFIVHFLLYPASNGYNSYFDKDEKSIGGLENPPPVNRGLYALSLTFDGLAILLGYLLINSTFAIMLLIYGAVSKAYSHPAIRLKKYPILGWLTVSVFQGFFTFVMCYVGLNNYGIAELRDVNVIVPALLSTAMLLGNYPMTQVYQHEEDAKHGDQTLSLLLGVRGTFYFVGGLFGVVTVLFVWYFNTFFSSRYAWIFVASLFPVVGFFLFWFSLVYRDSSQANFRYTMLLNFISATCLNVFFGYLCFQTGVFPVY